jgi:predicted heme/steroid binding protein/uncharacterized membrane protein
MKEFDVRTLSEFDGKDGRKPIYIARDGKVYDVTGSDLWESGIHMNEHHAGRDLTGHFPAAPHGEKVFESFKQVGILTERRETLDERLPPRLRQLFKHVPFLKRHPHPMLVHYPIVFMFSTAGFILLAMLTGYKAFDTTALHCLGAGLLLTPLAIASGVLTWWVNYGARPMRPVRIKILGSLVLMLVGVIVFSWRLAVPDILTAGGSGTFIYVLLACSLVPVVSIVGWFGAQLTFPLGK